MTIFGIIFFIAAFILFIVLGYGCTEIKILTSILLTLMSIIIIVALSMIGLEHEKDNKIGRTDIYSISVNSQLEGSFFLGSGTINEELYYYFVKKGKHGHQIDKIKVDEDLYVLEGEKKPHIEFTKYKCVKQSWFSKLFFKPSVFYKGGEKIIHVPRGTIIRNYIINVNQIK